MGQINLANMKVGYFTTSSSTQKREQYRMLRFFIFSHLLMSSSSGFFIFDYLHSEEKGLMEIGNWKRYSNGNEHLVLLKRALDRNTAIDGKSMKAVLDFKEPSPFIIEFLLD